MEDKKLISAEKGYVEFEQAFISAHKEIGWKGLLYFVMLLLKHYQPKSTNYSLKSYIKEHKNGR